jgi:hypothetical protein
MQRGRTCDNKFFVYFIKFSFFFSPKLYPTDCTYGSVVCLSFFGGGLTLQGGAACESELMRRTSTSEQAVTYNTM